MNKSFIFIRKNIIIIITIFNLSFLFDCNIFAEEKEAIQTYYPADISLKLPPPSAIETEINALKKSIKGFGYLSEFVAYKAVRENDLSICTQGGDQDCKEVAKECVRIRTFAEGSCDKLKDEKWRNICVQLKENNCSVFSDWKKDMCEGFLKEDITLIEKAYISLYGKKEKVNIDIARRLMAIFMGYKYYNSQTACEKFDSQIPLPGKLLCNVIFGTQDVDEILDRIARDVAVFTLAKQYGNSELCDRIKDSGIKKRCLDKAITIVW
ncbi:MAG: hypothetical protein AABY84_06090 [Candidatus Firestonebacteria bacterium]